MLYIHHPNFQTEKKKSDLVNKLLDSHYGDVYTKPESSPTARLELDIPKSPGDYLDAIKDLEVERDDLLEGAQDIQYIREIEKRHKRLTQEQWDLYHAAKEGS